MKQVPYKCRFGHVIIKEFYGNEPTHGTIECGKCFELVGNIEEYTKENNTKSTTRIRRIEKAVRI